MVFKILNSVEFCGFGTLRATQQRQDFRRSEFCVLVLRLHLRAASTWQRSHNPGWCRNGPARCNLGIADDSEVDGDERVYRYQCGETSYEATCAPRAKDVFQLRNFLFALIRELFRLKYSLPD